MTKTIRRRRKPAKSNHKIFKHYDKGQKGYLTLKEFKRLLRDAYHITYSSHIMKACYSTWFTNKRLSKSVFLKMYDNPDGFLRDR